MEYNFIDYKFVDGFGKNYRIYEDGAIFNTEKILNQKINKKYRNIRLYYDNGSYKNFTLSNLIYETFVSKIPKK